MFPKILIVSLEDWPVIARMPKSLQKAGFKVGVLCQAKSYLASTRYVDKLFPCCSKRFGSRIFRQLLEINRTWKPLRILPGDDRTVLFIQSIINQYKDTTHASISLLIEKLNDSMGNLDWIHVATSKQLTLKCAGELGIRTPRFEETTSLDKALVFAEKTGWPVVLKKSTSWGGGGTKVCKNAAELTTAYLKYSESYQWIGALKRAVIQARGWNLSEKWFPADLSFTVNEFITGTTAMVSVTASHGKILASTAVLKIRTYPGSTGPSSVVRFIRNEEMIDAVTKLIQHWKASGFFGFDFMLKPRGEAYLIECNPRVITLATMDELSGSNHCMNYYRDLAGLMIVPETPPIVTNVCIFPNEWNRNSESNFLYDSYHNVPWDDPKLLQRLINHK
jgi:hypothetical protein